MDNFYSAVISLLGLTRQNEGAAGVVFMLCKMAVANGSNGTYTGNPFSALKQALIGAGCDGYAYQHEGVSQLLTSAELRFASR